MDTLEAEEQPNVTNIYQLLDGETHMHCAIRNGDQNLIDKYIAAYQADFDKIRDYLVVKYQWNAEDKIWLRKYNMIAVSEEQCKFCKELEKTSPMQDIDMEKALFVILQTPIDREEVAVIHPDNNNRLKLFKIVRELQSNGILSWNYTNDLKVTNEGDETFIELAASQGRIDVISKLYELGADLSPPDHCPLLAACSTVCKDSIRWLLTEHFDHFDCTQRNSYNINALLVLMQEGDVEMLDYVLQKMIMYRQKYYNETETEAFKQIFHYEYEKSCLSSVGLTRVGPVQDKVGEYVSHYKLDLSYQWQRVTILICLMCRDIAVDYCWSEIRKNPKLLGLLDYNGPTVLQELIRMGKLDVLPEIYRSNPEVKQYFENEHGINLLRDMLIYSNVESAAFILEYHAEYLLSDLDTLRKNVLICNNPAFYDTNGDLLKKHFPMFTKEIDESKKKAQERYPDFYRTLDFENFNLEFNEFSIIAKEGSPPLNTIRGANGLTLLHYAVQKNNSSWFVSLLESGCDMDATDDEGNLPIHYVRSLEMFNLIIEKHPEGSSLVRRTNSAGYTVLHNVCCLRINHEVLCSLLEKIIECGADVNQLTKKGESALFMISGPGFNVLQKYNIDLEVVNNAGENALTYHLRFYATMAKTLFPLMFKLPSFKDHAHKYLPRFLTYNRGAFSYFFQSFFEENAELTKALFDCLYEHSAEEASRTFCHACIAGHAFIVEKFFEFDYDLDYNFVDEHEYTPIMGLCGYTERSNIHLMRQLLSKGVNLDHRNKCGRNTLLVLTYGFRIAEGNCHTCETVQLLLDHGAPINSTDVEGNTALHYAFKMEEWELMETLLANGADFSLKNKEGKIPLEMASDRNQKIFQFMQ